MRYFNIILMVMLPLLSLAQEKNESALKFFSQSDDHQPEKWSKNLVFEASLSAELLKKNFSQFESDLGSYNTNILNQENGVIAIGMGGYYKRYYASLIFGFTYEYSQNADSLEINVNSTAYGIDLGFRFIDSKRFALKPRLDFRWYRFRLLNSDIDRKIPLSQYMSDRELDIRFNQFMLIPGLDSDIKFYRNSPYPISNNYWSLGVFGGYPFKLNSVPLIFSKGSRLTTGNHLDLSNFYFVFSFRIFI